MSNDPPPNLSKNSIIKIQVWQKVKIRRFNIHDKLFIKKEFENSEIL